MIGQISRWRRSHTSVQTQLSVARYTLTLTSRRRSMWSVPTENERIYFITVAKENWIFESKNTYETETCRRNDPFRRHRHRNQYDAREKTPVLLFGVFQPLLLPIHVSNQHRLRLHPNWLQEPIHPQKDLPQTTHRHLMIKWTIKIRK